MKNKKDKCKCCLKNKKPYAYLIKHKFWPEDSQPEIYFPKDFYGDGCIDKDSLTMCVPIYLGEDEKS